MMALEDLVDHMIDGHGHLRAGLAVMGEVEIHTEHAAEHRNDRCLPTSRLVAEFGHAAPAAPAYRVVNHHRAEGDWCRWSRCSILDPHERMLAGNTACPDGCPDSDVEPGAA